MYTSPEKEEFFEKVKKNLISALLKEYTAHKKALKSLASAKTDDGIQVVETGSDREMALLYAGLAARRTHEPKREFDKRQAYISEKIVPILDKLREVFNKDESVLLQIASNIKMGKDKTVEFKNESDLLTLLKKAFAHALADAKDRIHKKHGESADSMDSTESKERGVSGRRIMENISKNLKNKEKELKKEISHIQAMRAYDEGKDSKIGESVYKKIQEDIKKLHDKETREQRFKNEIMRARGKKNLFAIRDPMDAFEIKQKAQRLASRTKRKAIMLDESSSQNEKKARKQRDSDRDGDIIMSTDSFIKSLQNLSIGRGSAKLPSRDSKAVPATAVPITAVPTLRKKLPKRVPKGRSMDPAKIIEAERADRAYDKKKKDLEKKVRKLREKASAQSSGDHEALYHAENELAELNMTEQMQMMNIS
jgi:hypothetical protein